MASAEVARKFFDVVEFKVYGLRGRLNTDNVFERISGGTNGEELFGKRNTSSRFSGEVANCAIDVAIIVVDGEEYAPDGAELRRRSQ